MSTVFFIIMTVQSDVMRENFKDKFIKDSQILWRLIVDLKDDETKIGDLRGYDSEAENVPAEEIKIDF